MYLLVVLYGFRGGNIAKQKPLIWYFWKISLEKKDIPEKGIYGLYV